MSQEIQRIILWIMSDSEIPFMIDSVNTQAILSISDRFIPRLLTFGLIQITITHNHSDIISATKNDVVSTRFDITIELIIAIVASIIIVNLIAKRILSFFTIQNLIQMSCTKDELDENK